MVESLHEKYVPIVRYARGERFYPMAVEDFLRYSALRMRGEATPLAEPGRVRPASLARAAEKGLDVYLQSVPARLADQNVAAGWNADVVSMLLDLGGRAPAWQFDLAGRAYDWLSQKTEGAAKLFWWNRLLMPLLDRDERLGGDLPRLRLPPEIRQAAVEAYEHSQPSTPNYTYYYRLTRDEHYHCLQYWLFYAFNDWASGFGGMNDHEGDWEGLYLFFKADSSGRPLEPPAYITYVGHNSRLTKPWIHPDVSLEGTHPVAFVGAGSHATYPECRRYDLMKLYGLVDYATGDGVRLDPDDWRCRIDLSTQPWAATFLGTWGTRYWLPLDWASSLLGRLRAQAEDISLPGVSAPRGPRFAEDGSERPNWTQSALWAGLLEMAKK